MSDLPWGIVISLVTGALACYTWVASLKWAKREQLTTLERSHAMLSERVRHLPEADVVSELSASMRELNVEVRGLCDSLKTVHRRLDLHEEWWQRGEA